MPNRSWLEYSLDNSLRGGAIRSFSPVNIRIGTRTSFNESGTNQNVAGFNKRSERTHSSGTTGTGRALPSLLSCGAVWTKNGASGMGGMSCRVAFLPARKLDIAVLTNMDHQTINPAVLGAEILLHQLG
jgi:hypothetical protein